MRTLCFVTMTACSGPVDHVDDMCDAGMVDATVQTTIPEAGSPEIVTITGLLPVPCTMIYVDAGYSLSVVPVNARAALSSYYYDAGACDPIIAIDGNSIPHGLYAYPMNGAIYPRGWPEIAWEYLPGICRSFQNNAQPALTTPMVDTLSATVTDPLYSACRPSNIVVFEEGTNDIVAGCSTDGSVYGTGCTASESMVHIATYVEHRRAVGWTVVIVPVPPSAWFPEATRAELNTMLPSLVAPHVYLVDVGNNRVWQPGAQFDPTLFNDGALHPTSLGHMNMASPILAAVLTAE